MQPKTKNLLQVNIAVMMLAGTAMFAKGIGLPVVAFHREGGFDEPEVRAAISEHDAQLLADGRVRAYRGT